MTGPFRVVGSRCLHPPPVKVKHMCVYESSLWILGPDGQWWGVGIKSATRANAILALCDSWADVILMADDLELREPEVYHPSWGLG